MTIEKLASSDAEKPIVRSASIGDVNAIHDLLAVYAQERLLLPRPQLDILERIGNFVVAEVDGEFAGCCALRDYGNGLYEVRSLAVMEKFTGRGIASAMVEHHANKLRARGESARLFALTYRDNFFMRLGFRIVDKSMFPEKIWSDCAICPKKERCDEIAVLTEIP